MKSFFQPSKLARIYLFKKSLAGKPLHITAEIPKHLKEILGTDYLSFHPEPARDSLETNGTIVARTGQTLEKDREWFQDATANNGLIEWGSYEFDGNKMKEFSQTKGMYLSDNGLFLLLSKKPVTVQPNQLILDLLQYSINKPQHDPLQLLQKTLEAPSNKKKGYK